MEIRAGVWALDCDWRRLRRGLRASCGEKVANAGNRRHGIIMTTISDERRVANAMQVIFEVTDDSDFLLEPARRILAMAKAGAGRTEVVEFVRHVQNQISGLVIDADREQLEAFVREVAGASQLEERLSKSEPF